MPHEIQLIHNFLYFGVMLIFALALITGVLYTLAHQFQRAVQIHNLIRDTKQVRAEYLAYRNRHNHK